MLVVPDARGLFSQAITESGPCSFPLPALSASEANGSMFTQAAGCQKTSANETVACLRQLSTADVLAKQPTSAELLASPTGLTAFFPNVDGKLIPQQTVTALTLGQFNRVPVIVGTNRDEGSLFIALTYDILGGAPLTAADYPKKIADTAKALAGQTGGNADQITQQILNEYPLSDYTSADQALAVVLGDGTFSCPALITDQLLSAQVSTYAYEFADRTAPMTLLPAVSFPYGATHTDELEYLFTHVNETPVLSTDQSQLASTMRHYWTQFASTGTPNAPLDTAHPYWPAFSLLTNDIQGFVAPTPALRPSFSADHHCTFWQSVLLQGALGGGAG